MTFAQRRNRLTTVFSERIPVVKRRVSVHYLLCPEYCMFQIKHEPLRPFASLLTKASLKNVAQ